MLSGKQGSGWHLKDDDRTCLKSGRIQAGLDAATVKTTTVFGFVPQFQFLFLSMRCTEDRRALPPSPFMSYQPTQALNPLLLGSCGVFEHTSQEELNVGLLKSLPKQKLGLILLLNLQVDQNFGQKICRGCVRFDRVGTGAWARLPPCISTSDLDCCPKRHQCPLG